MTDDRFSPRPVAGWYMPAAILSLLLVAGAVAIYVTRHLLVDPASLPLDVRAVYEAIPGWMDGLAAAALATGLLGTLALVARRKLAQSLLLTSLISALGWLAGLVAVPALREAISANDLAVAIAIAAVSWTIFWFARHSRQRGWLR